MILDHFLGRSLWIFFPQFSELRFGFNIVVWVLFPNNSSFLCIFQVRIFDLRLLIKDSNFYWLCQVLSLESDTRLCIKKLEWWCRQQTLRKLMKNMTRKSWIFWNWQSLPELSDLEKSDLKIRSRSVKKRSTIRSRSWSRKMVKSDLRSDQKVICRSRSWSVDQDRHYFVSDHRYLNHIYSWNLAILFPVLYAK